MAADAGASGIGRLAVSARRRAAFGSALNLAVFAAFVALVQWQWGWPRLLSPWRQLPALAVALAVVALLLSYLVRAARIYWAEEDIPRGRLLTCLRLVLINNAFNWLLPMRSGEASFPILMRRWFAIHPGRATGILVWLRLLDLHVLAAVGIVCAARGWLGQGMDLPAYLLAALLVSAPAVVYALRATLATALKNRRGRVAGLLAQALTGVPRRRGGLLRDLALTWSAWGVKLAALGWVLSRLGGLTTTLGILGAIGGDASTVLPVHAPGGFGTYEAGVLAVLAPAQIPDSRLLAAAVNLHLFVLTTALIAGAVAWLAAAPLLDSAPKSPD